MMAATTQPTKPTGYTDKQTVRVITVDQAQRRVECATRDGAMIYAAVWETPTAFRWPKTGEIWTVRKDTNVWRLDSQVDQTNGPVLPIAVEDMAEGETRIQGDLVYVNALAIGDGGGTSQTAIIGEVKEWAGIALPPSGIETFMWCTGTAISRATYKTLFETIVLSKQSEVSSGSKVVAFDSTIGMAAGMPISGVGIPNGTTIASVDSSIQITLSANATLDSSIETILVGPFGLGDYATTFNLPDYRGRVGMSPDNMGGTDAGRLATSAQQLGGSGGEEVHTLSTGEMPSHTHGFGGNNAAVDAAGIPSGAHNWGTAGSVIQVVTATDPAGSGQAHNNMQPYLGINRIIRVL